MARAWTATLLIYFTGFYDRFVLPKNSLRLARKRLALFIDSLRKALLGHALIRQAVSFTAIFSESILCLYPLST